MDKTLHTKWGTAQIGNQGYYRITSTKEGNKNKFLHRLIWEDFYGCKVPDGYVIHHKDFDKKCNCILNLQLMRDKDHRILHNTGENHPMYNKKHSKESKMKMSEAKMGHEVSDETKMKIGESLSKFNNTSGYFRVCKQKDKRCNQGWRWAYWYHDENGKRKNISSNDIEKLKAKVKSKGLKWKKLKGDE